MYDGNTVATLGETILPCSINGRIFDINFHVVKNSLQTIFGCATSMKCDIINVNNISHISEDERLKTDDGKSILSEYRDIFSGLGRLGDPYEIKLDSRVTPTVVAPRVPLALLKPPKTKLQGLE